MRIPLLHLLLASLASSEITFSVVEPPLHPRGVGHHRHHHKHRHGRDHPVAPAEKAKPERFNLNCPHVADADNPEVRIEVTWTLDDTVLLKIRDGEQIVFVNRTTFRKKSNDGKSVVHVSLFANRYMFSYDELTGDFSMEINEVQPEDDFGVWQCHIKRRRGSETFSESTMKTIVGPPGAAARRAAAAAAKGEARQQHPVTAAYHIESMESGSQRAHPRARIDYGSEEKRTTKFSSFTRQDSNAVLISRDSVDARKQTIVFDREQSVTKDYRHSVDYEMSIDYGDHSDHPYDSYKRVRAAAIGSGAVSRGAGAFAVLLAAITVFLL